MKKIFFPFLMTFIVIGMVIPALAGSPNGGKTTTGNLKQLPPSSWNLNILVTDPNDSCYAITNCNVGFLISWAFSNCAAISSIYNYTYPFTFGQARYSIAIPDTISCVLVSINPGSCSPSDVNSNTCCECKSNNQVCKLRICP